MTRYSLDREVHGHNRDCEPADSPLSTTARRRGVARRIGLAGKLEALLWTVAALALGAASFGYADAALYQRRHADVDFTLTRSEPADAPAHRAFTAVAAPDGTPIARLTIPRLGLEAVVAEGTERSTLRHAVGRLPKSGLPGEVGNIALAAHRDTFFRPLENIQNGDELVLESAAGRDSYFVEWTSVVEPDDMTVVADTDYPAITLITCYPFRYVGDAPQRFVVRARRAESTPSSPQVGAAPAAGASRG